MPFSQEGFDPETIALLESCLDQAVTLAATRVRIGEGLRHMLAAALIEGYDHMTCASGKH